MPTISRFYGIEVEMYYRDHLPPHFHAWYGDDEVLINVNELTVYAGDLPKQAMRLVLEWAQLNQPLLLANWDLARASQPLSAVPPLS